MHFQYFLIVTLSYTMAQNFNTGFCDKKTKNCADNAMQTEEVAYQKYLFYDVNPPEGFNLRRDVYMRFAIMLAESRKAGKKSNWNLVLPPWYRMYHWKTESDRPIPWSKFFDVDSLKSFAPVVELHELVNNSSENGLRIDILYVLQNYEDPFEGGTFIDKWEMSDDDNCHYDGDYWGNTNIDAKEVICVKFQGSISMLWELVALHPHDKKIMFAHGEIPLHDTYGTKPYWDCRKSMRFNRELVNEAYKYISNYLECEEVKCSNYISVHWRRQDFARGRSKLVPSITGTAKQIDAVIKKRMPYVNEVFIASDAADSELRQLENQLISYSYSVYFYVPNEAALRKYREGGVAIIEQIICSHAAYFLGTHESTFSYRIQEEREILCFDSSTTFNRLCPDKGHCEQPSVWTIVN